MKYHEDGTAPTDGCTILVYGSNLAGIHGAGAAKEAFVNFGAEYGIGIGLVGDSYGIPTKDKSIETLALDYIEGYVEDFVEYTHKNPHLNFWLTRVGCGLAGYTDAEIAPMFKGIGDNCNIPLNWKEYL